MSQEAWIIDAVRSPRGKGKPTGGLHGVHPQRILGQVLNALQQRVGFETREVDDVIMGSVGSVGDHAMDIARMAVLDEKAGMTFDDIDLFEVNEAFASVVLEFLRLTGIDSGKVNVNGGAMALGHPIGATGGMLVGTLLDELERRDLETGLVAMCSGGGMGTATIIQRI